LEAVKRTLSSLLLVLLLLCGLTDRAEAAVTPPQKTASGSLDENPDKYTYTDPLLVVELQRDRELWGYDVVLDVDIGPNLYAYVNQNPWSKFDPLGLYLMEKMPGWYQSAASNPIGSMVMPGAMALQTVDGAVAEPAAQGVSVYKTSRASGNGVATSAVMGAGWNMARQSGGIDAAEVITGDAYERGGSGLITSRKMSTLERVHKGTAVAVGVGLGVKGLRGIRAGSNPGGMSARAQLNAQSGELASVFDGYKPGQKFSGIMTESGQVVIKPSSVPVNGVVPEGHVPANGGHSMILNEISDAGTVSSNPAAFTMELGKGGNVRMHSWISRINGQSTAANGQARGGTPPVGTRQQVRRSLLDKTNKRVLDDEKTKVEGSPRG